jgi:putative intracellular protease/amidase
MKILMVLTSHNQLGNTGLPTGFWLEEFAAPYFVFRDAGIELTLASPKGGQPALDPKAICLKIKRRRSRGSRRTRRRKRLSPARSNLRT